jgi:hypothetical protein
MPSGPSRIDLLELDIDLRLADLWREAAGISEWSLDVVAAFMRAAYGKGALCRSRLSRAGAQADSRRRRLAFRLAKLPSCPRAVLRG